MIKKILFLILLGIVFSSLMITSCATIKFGRKSTITITADPTEVQIEVIKTRSGKVLFSGVTPAEITLSKNDSVVLPAKYLIKATVPGKNTITIELNANEFQTEWYIAGNLLTLGVGWFVDLFTGAMYDWNLPKVSEGKGSVAGGVSAKKENTLHILYKE